jgi:hypothetical protein
MSGQRKLFIAHASELAHLCVRSVQRGGLVAEFVRAYAERNNRPGRAVDPERSREFDSTIGREALLVMAARVRRMLPAAFAHANERSRNRGRRDVPPKLAPEDAAFSEAFYSEFLASLGRSLEWSLADTAAESAAFRRDLEMYQRWSSGSPAGRDVARESPFADRCALLLDPAMMEQARRAASEFEVVVDRAAARMFAQLGLRTAIPKHPVRRAPSRRPSRIRAARRKVPPLTRGKKSHRSRNQMSRPRLRTKKIARPSRAKTSSRKRPTIRHNAAPRKNRRGFRPKSHRKPRTRA